MPLQLRLASAERQEDRERQELSRVHVEAGSFACVPVFPDRLTGRQNQRSRVAHPDVAANIEARIGGELRDQVGQAVERNVVTLEELALLRDPVADRFVAGKPTRSENGVVPV